MGLCSAYERERVGRRMFRPVIPWDHHTAHLVDRHGLLGHGLRSLLASPGYTHACAIADWHVLGGTGCVPCWIMFPVHGPECACLLVRAYLFLIGLIDAGLDPKRATAGMVWSRVSITWQHCIQCISHVVYTTHTYAHIRAHMRIYHTYAYTRIHTHTRAHIRALAR